MGLVGFLGLSPAATEEKLGGGGEWLLRDSGEGGPFFLAGDAPAAAYEEGGVLASADLVMGMGTLLGVAGGGVCLGLEVGLGSCMAFSMN